MSKFNVSKDKSNLTENECGCVAYDLDDKLKLLTMTTTTFFSESKFYGDTSDKIVDLANKLIKKGNGQYVANLAVYLRKEMHLRSMAQVLVVLLASNNEGKAYVRYACDGVIERADDITEILACYISKNGKPIANSLKKGLAGAMNKFDEYQFAKYNRKSKMVSFKDVLNLTHAKAKDEAQNAIFKAIMEDRLKTPYTWETELSAKGNTKEVWEGLISSNKLGYMALLRNLNNIINAEPDNMDKALSDLTNGENVRNSKVLPFRFYSAYKRLAMNAKFTSKVYDALETAIDESVANIEKLKGKTLIAIDVSGSMNSPLSSRSDMCYVDVACVIGAMANKLCEDSIVVTFDNRLKVVTFSNKNGIISNAKSINATGGYTYCNLPIEYILKNKIFVDRVIMLSDDMCNFSYVEGCYTNYSVPKKELTPTKKVMDKYRKEVNANVFFHMIDLAGYGTSEVNYKEKLTSVISGWDENVLNYVSMYEKGFDEVVRMVENYHLKK